MPSSSSRGYTYGPYAVNRYSGLTPICFVVNNGTSGSLRLPLGAFLSQYEETNPFYASLIGKVDQLLNTPELYAPIRPDDVGEEPGSSWYPLLDELVATTDAFLQNNSLQNTELLTQSIELAQEYVNQTSKPSTLGVFFQKSFNYYTLVNCNPLNYSQLSTTWTGEILNQDSKYWELASQNHQRLLVMPKPCIVMYPSSPQETVSAIQALIALNLPFSIRGGGHNSEGLSIVHGGTVIDTSKMNSIQVDLASNTVTIGAGALLINVYHTLFSYNMLVPAGSCPTVGAIGLALGGGYGYTSRSFGLFTDQIVEFEVATPSGVLTANSMNNPDL